jgi:hypothetical protein
MRQLWFRLRCWWNGYDSAFVRKVLDADAAPPESGFNNVEDLLKYLNAD